MEEGVSHLFEIISIVLIVVIPTIIFFVKLTKTQSIHAQQIKDLDYHYESNKKYFERVDEKLDSIRDRIARMEGVIANRS